MGPKKLMMIKALQSNLIKVSETLKTDIEASNKGIFALSSSGNLIIVVWVKKKVLLKQIEDVSDALWQKKGSSELIAACHSGAIFRYTINDDTGLTKSLQLSAKSLLALLSAKDSSITSVKGLRIWGHSTKYLLLQPQPDRLVLLSTNSKARPEVLGTIKTSSLRVACLTSKKIFVQPFTGSDIYVHDIATCKTIEVISLVVTRPGVSYIQWDSLICNSSASQIAVTDCERRIYVAKLSDRKYLGKKIGGVTRSKLVPHQVVWPTNFKPSSLNNFLVYLSEEVLSVFCSMTYKNKENSYYLIHHLNHGGNLTLEHKFSQNTFVLPGLPQELPDLFLCDDGVYMLTDESCSVTGSGQKFDFDDTLKSLKEALDNWDIEKIYKIKTAVEEDLSLFLSTCNYKENWTDLVEIWSKQHARLVDILLSFLTKSSSSSSNKTTLLGLKELLKHHILNLREEMSNVLMYVDAEKVSQLLLQMLEQMNFYASSVDSLKLPEGKEEDTILLEKFEIWADEPVKVILLDALQTKCVQIAENYLTLKPWIYGTMDGHFIVGECIDIARQNIHSNLLLNMDKSYETELKKCLHASKDLNELRLLEGVLDAWNILNPKEELALTIVKYIHKFSPHMILKPPIFWLEMLIVGSDQEVFLSKELTVGMFVKCTFQSLNLVLLDIYARANDIDILDKVDMKNLWKYLLIREDEYHLYRWIYVQLDPGRLSTLVKPLEMTKIIDDVPSALTPVVKDRRSRQSRSVKNKPLFKKQTLGKSALSGTIYGSDTESMYSLDSTVWEGVDESIKDTSDTSVDSLNMYQVSDWSDDFFGFIDQSMIDDIVSSKDCFLTDLLLNSLAHYGLFQSNEKLDPQIMIRRVMESEEIISFHPINSQYFHKVEKVQLDDLVLQEMHNHDLSSPFFNYVISNSISEVKMDSNYEKPWLKLVRPFQKMNERQAKEVIYELCLETLSYMVIHNEHMIDDFFSVLLTMLYAPNATISDFIQASHAGFDFTTLEDAKAKDIKALCNILSKQYMTPLSVLEKLAFGDYPFLQNIIREPINFDQPPDISIYDLLRGSVPFDIGTLFTWQKNNKHGYSSLASIPSLEDEALIKKEGVECSLDYYYYLKAGRPTYALASILLTTKGEDPESSLKDMTAPVYGLALSSWPDKRICSACVALLFLTSLDYQSLRTLLFAADTIITVLEKNIFSNFEENLKKSQMKLLTNEVRDMLCQLCSISSRKDAAFKFISLFEDSIIAKIMGRKIDMKETPYQIRPETYLIHDDALSSQSNIYHLLQTLQLTNDIASIYELERPLGILKFLAEADQWILFLAAAQMFEYSPSVVVNLAMIFKSESLKEHIQFSLENTRLLHERSVPSSILRTKVETTNTQTLTTEENKTGLSLLSSTVSSVSKLKRSDSKNETKKIEPKKFESTTDLFSLMINLNENEDPCERFLDSCLSYKCPILAVIAACYDKSKRFNCLTAWLYTQLPNKTLNDLMNGQIFLPRQHIEKKFLPFCLNDIILDAKMNNSLKDLITLLLDLGCIDILQDGFKIFDQNSPSLFILEALDKTKSGGAQVDINLLLGRACSDVNRSYVSYSTEQEISSRFSVFLTCRGLDLYLKNKYFQRVFLTALLPYGKRFPFSCKAINWDLLKEVVFILGNVNTPFNVFEMIAESEDFSFEAFVPKLLDCLIQQEEYEKSLQLSELFSLGTFDILCSQLKSDFDLLNKVSLKEVELKDFLTSTHLKATASDVPPDVVCCLFKSMAKCMKNTLFRFFILQYAVLWGYMQTCYLKTKHLLNFQLNPSSSVSKLPFPIQQELDYWRKNSEDIELLMWLCYMEYIFEAKSKVIDGHLTPLFGKWPWELESNRSLDYSQVKEASLLYYKVHENSSQESTRWSKLLALGISEKELDSIVSGVIAKCLEMDVIVTACRLSNHFDIQDKNVNAILNMLSKACEGPYSTERDAKSPCFSRKTSSSSSHYSLFEVIPSLQVTQGGTGGLWLTTLQKLSMDIPNGNRTVKRLLSICRVLDILNLDFLEVVHNSETSKLLKNILCERTCDGIQLVKDLIGALEIPSDVVTRLLLDEVVAVVSAGPKGKFTDLTDSHFIDWDGLDEKWLDLLVLTEDSSVLGYLLMDVFQSLTKESHPDHLAKGQMMSVELIIRAHDCFSEAAHMEGINVILQASPDLTKALLKHKQWALMGRLLTGIRRYKEMSYLIDILRDNQQFERLLQKNSDQKLNSSGLDKALVHFLHSNYPDDKEMLRMVALHFLMFSELASMWSEEGDEMLNNILKSFLFEKPSKISDANKLQKPGLFSRRPLPQYATQRPSRNRTDSMNADGKIDPKIDFLKGANVRQLSDAMQCFYYASQYCAQEKQLVTAMRHSRTAELIALQLSLVKSAGSSGLALRIVNLPPPVLQLVMVQHLSVREVIIVSRSYDVLPDWGSALYFHFIKNGFRKFLLDFLQFYDMSTEIVLSIVKKVEKHGLEPEYKERMCFILNYVQEFDFVYKIASQLGIRSLVKECLEPPYSCYLKDTVFSQGISS